MDVVTALLPLGAVLLGIAAALVGAWLLAAAVERRRREHSPVGPRAGVIDSEAARRRLRREG